MFNQKTRASLFSVSTLKKSLFLLCAAPLAVMAQEWPAKPVTFLNPFPAGGGTDAFARPLAAQLTEQMGKHLLSIIVVERVALLVPQLQRRQLLMDTLGLLVRHIIRLHHQCIKTWITTLKRVFFL